jgi:hypothetical protein
MLILPGYWPDTYWGNRYWTANYWPEYGTPIPPMGTDRKIRRGREKWKPVEVKVILRDPPIQTIINRQKLARDMRVEGERLAEVDRQEREAAVKAAVQLVEQQAKDAAAAFERRKVSMANLALAQLAREKNRKAEEARQERIRQIRIANLRKAKKKR